MANRNFTLANNPTMADEQPLTTLATDTVTATDPPIVPRGWLRLRNSWRRRSVFFCGAILLALAVHGPVLRGLAWLLIADTSSSSARTILILGGDRWYEEAAARFRQGTCDRALFFETQPGRLQMLGILPRSDELGRHELVKRGVADDAIELIRWEPVGVNPEVQALDKWLAAHPDQGVEVLCNRFSSRELGYVYDTHIDPERRGRVSIRALPDRRYDESNWWRSKTGIKAFFSATFDLCYTALGSERPRQDVDLDPDKYEQAVFE